MKINPHISSTLIMLLLGSASRFVHAQTVNTWRGDAIAADWNDACKWNLHHPPSEGEAAHFREDNSVISINSTIQLENGMHLYGTELLLTGNGNINLWSQVPHECTVNIPASTTGYANLTLCDNLSLNGRIALSAKSLGTSSSKGIITLRDRATVTGGLVIGNEGVGSGRVVVLDNATFRITGMKIDTRVDKGGLAEIHILGGTVRMEGDENLFDILMADPGRKIILGDMGTLRIESDLPIEEKKEVLKQLIINKRLVPATGCRLSLPILQDEMMIARAEDMPFSSTNSSTESIIEAIDHITTSLPKNTASPIDLEELVKAHHEEVNSVTGTITAARAEAGESRPLESPHKAGYIVFLGALLLTVRKAKRK